MISRAILALRRRYRYSIYNHRLRPAVLAKGVTHYYEPRWMQSGHARRSVCLAKMILPRFVWCECQSRTPWRM